MIYLRIAAMLGALFAVFLLGMWLTWPELAYNPTGFPDQSEFRRDIAEWRTARPCRAAAGADAAGAAGIDVSPARLRIWRMQRLDRHLDGRTAEIDRPGGRPATGGTVETWRAAPACNEERLSGGFARYDAKA
jgi:hypothetical protein